MRDKLEFTSHEELVAELSKDPEYRWHASQLQPYMEVSVAIIKKRNALGWTIKELAEKANVSVRCAKHAELGDRKHLKLDELLRIADALGLKVSIGFEQGEDRYAVD